MGVAEDPDAPGPGDEAQVATQARDRRAGGEHAPEGPAGRDPPAQGRRPLPRALGRHEPVEAADREVRLPVGQAIGVDDGPRVAELARRVQPAGEGPRVVDEVVLAGPGVARRRSARPDPRRPRRGRWRWACATPKVPAAPTTSVPRTTPGRPRGTRLSSSPASGRVNKAPKTACLLSPTELAVSEVVEREDDAAEQQRRGHALASAGQPATQAQHERQPREPELRHGDHRRGHPEARVVRRPPAHEPGELRRARSGSTCPARP